MSSATDLSLFYLILPGLILICAVLSLNSIIAFAGQVAFFGGAQHIWG